MPFNHKRPIEVHVCYGHERFGEHPHWLISLQSPGADQCTWIHSTGGPTQNRDYERSIQADKDVNSRQIAFTSLQGTVSPQDIDAVVEAAKSIEPQQCQMYVVAVVAALEKKGLLPEGRTAFLKDQVQMSEKSRDYRRENPISKPAVAYTQEAGDEFYGRRK